MGLGKSRRIAFVIDFGIAKEYWSTATGTHVSFHQDRHLTGTPAFASINSHVGFELGRCDDLESLIYMLIYFLRGSLPWLTSDHKKLSSSSILERKVNTSVESLCHGVPPEFATMLIYSRSLAFSEAPDYHYIRSLLYDLRATVPISAADSLDFTDDINDLSLTPCRLEAVGQQDDPLIHPSPCSNDHSVAEGVCFMKAPLRRSTRRV